MDNCAEQVHSGFHMHCRATVEKWQFLLVSCMYVFSSIDDVLFDSGVAGCLFTLITYPFGVGGLPFSFLLSVCLIQCSVTC